MENKNTVLSENDMLLLAFEAGASQLEAIINNNKSCVIIENVINQFNPEENIFRFQHESGRVYHLQQQLHARTAGTGIILYEIVWGLVSCSMNDTPYNLTNLRRHRWIDWLSDKSITDDRQQYFWFRFHGKRLSRDICNMTVDVYDDGHINVKQLYCARGIVSELLNDTSHLANNIRQKELKSDSNYISGYHKRKQMMEVVNSVMAIEGPVEHIVKAFNPDVFKLTQKIDQDTIVLFDEIDTAKVKVQFKALLPAFENLIAFSFTYEMTVNTLDYTTKCDDAQVIDVYSVNSLLVVNQIYKGTVPFRLQFDLLPNAEKYTYRSYADYVRMKLCDISKADPSTGKSFIQEFTDNYLKMLPIINAIKGVC